MLLVQPWWCPAGLVVLATLNAGCASTPPPGEPVSPAVLAVAYSADGARLLVAKRSESGCELLELDAASHSGQARHELPVCPDDLNVREDGVLMDFGSQSAWWAGDSGETVLAAARKDDYVQSDGDKLVWIRGERHIPLPALKLRGLRVLDRENLLLGIRTEADGESLVRVTESGEVTSLIPEPIRRIDSFDVSPDQKEFVLSALRERGFDIALGSTASADVRWVATDPLDEVMVSWAPRGSKVTYVVRGLEGSLLRTLHVPTGYELMIDLPHTEVTKLAWEPKAERFAVVVSGPGRSSGVMTMAYGGEERRIVLPPEHEAAIELEPFLWEGGADWMVRPSRVAYGASYPVIVWTGVDAPFGWDEARGESHINNEAISILAAGGIDSLSESFWSAIERLPLADRSRIFIVDEAGRKAVAEALPPGARIVREDGVPRGLRASLRDGNSPAPGESER